MDGFIGLGTNLGDRARNLETGLAGLAGAGLVPLSESAVWETEPVDSPGAPWFWNMAVKVETDLAPREILELLQRIERQAGRAPAGARNAPRELDLDLLMLGNLQISEPRIVLPHPRMWQRSFVLEPLAEIAPALEEPGSGRTIDEARRQLRGHAVVRRLGALAAAAAARVGS